MMLMIIHSNIIFELIVFFICNMPKFSSSIKMNNNITIYNQHNSWVFLNIPNFAGQEIEEWGHSHKFVWGKYASKFNLFGSSNSKKYRVCTREEETCCSHWYVPPDSLSHSKYYKHKKQFCVVQHPYTRILSQINWTWQHWNANNIAWSYLQSAKKKYFIQKLSLGTANSLHEELQEDFSL